MPLDKAKIRAALAPLYQIVISGHPEFATAVLPAIEILENCLTSGDARKPSVTEAAAARLQKYEAKMWHLDPSERKRIQMQREGISPATYYRRRKMNIP
jgi:hypothetical protein